uniref:Putative synaptojanin (N-terminal domain) n=1 Tax=Trypanosoma congolense (strain IL3000) TaxID=1068625 RepID=G0UUF3_TRYCI|nr:putative synaptojanin (N-terminal domain) [Trypanosoma congolense IL3000]
MSSRSVSGRICICSKLAFFVPNDYPDCIWKWDSVDRCFVVAVDDDDECFSSVELCFANVLSSDFDHDGFCCGEFRGIDEDDVSLCIPCCALFGVLSIGSTSVLLYVAEQEKVATLPINGSPDIFAVRKLSWVLLPSAEGADTICNDVSTNSEVGMGSGRDAAGPGVPSANDKAREIIFEYCGVVKRFCECSNSPSGASYFYYSPTFNLALDPGEVVGVAKERSSGSFHGGDVNDGRLFTQNPNLNEKITHENVFQWNSPLLDAFEDVLPSMSCGGCCYVPAFIRGVVVSSSSPDDGVDLLLVNRLSYRWSGTRYNRRGLDNAGSGITANFSASTLWVFRSGEDGKGCGDLAGEHRAAAFTMLRGSVPRCWSQPANLSLIPTITISSASSGVEEIASHLNALSMLFGDMESVWCLDLNSMSKTELALSKAFESAIAKFREENITLLKSKEVHYIKYDVKERRTEGVSYDHMLAEIDLLLKEESAGNHSPIDFWKFSTEDTTTTCDNVSNPPPTPVTDDARGTPPVMDVVYRQKHYIRVNCLDCLDRTNLVQSMIAISTLPRLIRYVHGLEGDETNARDGGTSDLKGQNEFHASKELCKQMWVKQGVALSQLYAGSDPHFVQFLLGGTWGRLNVGEVKIALQRWLQQNFYDGEKQDAISLITGQHNPAPFHSQYESPFSRHFSGLNWMVLGGMVAAVVAAIVNSIVLLVPKYWMRGEVVFFEVLWVVYIAVIVSRIMKDGTSYTNYPLLK